MLTEKTVLELLAVRCLEAGGAAEFARRHGLSDETVYVVLRGKRSPGPSVLKALGLKTIVRYEFIDE